MRESTDQTKNISALPPFHVYDCYTASKDRTLNLLHFNVSVLLEHKPWQSVSDLQNIHKTSGSN